MSDVIDRPLLEQEATAPSRLRIIDCDIHPSLHAAPTSIRTSPGAGSSILRLTAIICERPTSAPRPIRGLRR